MLCTCEHHGGLDCHFAVCPCANMSEQESLLPQRNQWDSATRTFRHKRGDDSDDGSVGSGEYVRSHTIRRDVWTILRYRSSIAHRSCLQRASYAFEASVLVLILLNVLLAMRESAVIADNGNESYVHSDWYDSFLYVSTIIFSIEYALRLWSCVEDDRFHGAIVGRLTWMVRPMSVIDLIVLVPFYVEIFTEYQTGGLSRGALTLRGLRLLRIMSFLRLERSYSALKNIRELFSQKREELWVVSYLTAVIVVTASTTIFFLENSAQPEVFSSLGVCMWWAIETITSLGYGDIVPITSGGRFFSSILALWGIILFTIPGAILSSGFVEIMLQKEETNKRLFEAELRRTFSRELEALSSSGFKNGRLDVGSDGDTLSAQSASRRLNEQLFQQLQEQVQRLTSLQEQVQSQLRSQKTQLDAIQRLVEANSTPRPSRVSAEMPPFSEIVVPESK